MEWYNTMVLLAFVFLPIIVIGVIQWLLAPYRRKRKSPPPPRSLAGICYHPGEHVKDEMEARGWDVKELAKRMSIHDMPVEIAENLIECKCDVDTNIAFGLARAFDTSYEIWMNLQKSYDIWKKCQKG